MEQNKKIIYGSQRGYNRAIARLNAEGWTIIHEDVLPRTKNRHTYIAYLLRKTDELIPTKLQG